MKHFGWMSVSLMAVLSIKEDVAIVLVPMVGLLWIDDIRSWRWPAGVAVLSLFFAWFGLTVGMPLATPSGQTWDLFSSRYGHWGATPTEALSSMVERPQEVVSLIFARPVNYQLRQFAYGPMLDPIGLIASIPTILEQRLSSFDAQQEFAYYYGVGTVAIWILALCRGVRWTERRIGFFGALLVATAPLLYHPHARVLSQVAQQDLEDAQILERLVPSDADIIAQTNIVPHLPVSPRVRLFPGPAQDFVALRPSGCRWPATDEQYLETVTRLLETENFGVVVMTPTLLVLKKGAPQTMNQAAKSRFLSTNVNPQIGNTNQ